MELYIYDTDLTLKGVVDEITSFIWTRRYWSIGEFKLLVPFTDTNIKLMVKGNLIIKNGDKEAGYINYINIKKNAYGLEEIEVQGKFTANWLNNYIMLNQIVTNDTSENIMNKIVADNIINAKDSSRKISNLYFHSKKNLGGEVLQYVSEPFISCGLALETVSKAGGLGFNIITDVKAKKHFFEIYQGKNLTATQSVLRPCIFSQEFDNVFEEEYTNSLENLKTVAYVGGEEKEGETRQIVKVGSSSGLNCKEIFINASDITRAYKDGEEEKILPLSTYIKMLEERGKEELMQYTETLNFSSKINAFSNLLYKGDFDIGDIVTCVNKRWGIKINARITEITESYQENEMEIDITFGESFPTLISKLMKKR